VILAITVVMVGAIAFSGGSAPSKPASSTTAQKPAPVIDPNLARIQEYRNRIDEQARKLAAEQAQLEQAKQTLLQTPPTVPSAPGNPYASAPYPTQQYQPPPPKPEKDPIEADKERREYQSLFASNVALSYRQDESSAPATGAVKPPDHQTDKKQESVSVTTTASAKADPELQKADGKQYRLFEGTILETVLTNRLSGSFNGPVNCMVTTDVYSHDRQHVLIPKGSRVLGEAKRNDSFGQQRLAVVFHRIIMPDGYSVNLDQFQGLNQIGETGLRDKVNNHYGQIFGVSLAVGALAGLASINTGSGFNASTGDLYRQGVTANLSQSSLRILDRYLNILPTFTIREGHRVKIVLSDDLLLPALERHRMPSDL
jgi:type IV secretion system protein VirB10